MKKILCALLVAVAAFGVACDKSTEIKVMSYNIRYLNNKDGENHWDNRKHASINMIREELPTVFGTQEGVWEQMSYFVENLPEYGHIGIGQDDGKLEGEIMSIFYHKDKVELLDGGIFWLSETPDVPSIGWGASQHRSCTWTKMRDKKSGKEFFYLNTHVDNEGSIAKVESIKLIKEKVLELNPYGFPVIITGDFNAELAHAMFEPFGEWLFDARSTAAITDTKPSYHGFGKYSTKIDHIFYTGLAPLEYETITKTYEGVTYISDHYPIAALFELKGSANPDDPQAPGNYGDLKEEDFPLNDYNEPPYSGGSYGDMNQEDYPLQ